jgi:hypothetical protein
MQNTVRIPHQVTSLLLCSTDSKSFHMNSTQFKPNNPWEGTPSLLLRLLVKFFGKEYSDWAMPFTDAMPSFCKKTQPSSKWVVFQRNDIILKRNITQVSKCYVLIGPENFYFQVPYRLVFNLHNLKFLVLLKPMPLHDNSSVMCNLGTNFFDSVSPIKTDATFFLH